jgi:hypothetical protein
MHICVYSKHQTSFRQYGKYVTQHGHTIRSSGRQDDSWQQGRSWTALRFLSCRTLPRHAMSIVITRAEDQPESRRWVHTGRPRFAPAHMTRRNRGPRDDASGRTRKLPSAGRPRDRGSRSQVGGAGRSERLSPKIKGCPAQTPSPRTTVSEGLK